MSHVKFDEEQKIWSACDDPSIYNPNISLGHTILRSLELFGPKIAQISDDTGHSFTFQELRLKTIRAAQNLQKRSLLKPKQVVGIIAGNVADLAPIVFALTCLGCPISSMPTMWKRYIIGMLQKTEPTLIFCEAKLYDMVKESLIEVGNEAKVFTFNGTKGDSETVESLFEETGNENDFIPIEVDGVNDRAFIMSTSGSTGSSKGVCLSHAALIYGFHTINIRMHANGIVFNPSSIYWVSGVITLLLGTVSGATRVITTEESSPEMQLRLIRDYKLTIVEIESTYLIKLLKNGLMTKSDLLSIKHMIIGGCKIPYSIQEEFCSYLPNGNLHNVYGLTEVGDVSIDYPTSNRKDTVGRLVGGVTVKIIDEEGNRCGINVDGEVCVKSCFKFIGYYKDKKLTEEALDSEGFFLTGDIGRIDEEGYLYIGDRKKNVIFHPSAWVFPTEIEEVLLRSPEIKNACVVGVPFDSAFEIPAAVVVRAQGSQITEKEICKMVEENLAEQCQLRGGVYFIQSIPLTTTEKPLRREIKEIATKYYKAKSEQRE